MTSVASLANRVALALLWCYRKAVSPLKPQCCRFTPTCSAYAREALVRFGLIKGSWLAFRRIMRCHPLYHGNLFDPVPGASESVREPRR